MTDITYHNILRPLLSALNWRGQESQLLHSLPFGDKIKNLQELRDVMAHLGYNSIVRSAHIQSLGADLFPALLITDADAPQIIRNRAEADAIGVTKGTFAFFRSAQQAAEDTTTSLRYEMRRFRPLLAHITLLSLIIGALTLAPIFFNRGIYDHVIASGSTKGMDMLVIGVLVALTAEMTLRHMRNRWLGYFGGRVDHFVSRSVFERLMYLPPLYTERASISSQLARLRDFENVREFFTGPLSTLFFEMPLIIIYMIAMVVISKWLVLVPVVLLVCYCVLILLVNRKMKENNQASATAATQRQEFLLETVTKLKSIRLAGMEKEWMDRYRALSGQASLAAFRAGFTGQALETGSYVLMTIGGVATLSFGIIAVINEALTVGGLVSAMLLIWRIIAPMQICCASISRIQQLSSSTKQVQRLLSVPAENDPYGPPMLQPNIQGRISFHRVSLRYSSDTEPALLGVSFDIRPGQIVAIMGDNGSGKSSILKLVLGLYQPQSGSVRIDGIDIRQFNPIALRQTVAYIPQAVDFFPGTIRDNLKFVCPTLKDSDIEKAVEDSIAAGELRQLPQGLDTPVEGKDATSLSFILRHRLNLARAYIKPAPIMLFDEASYSLGVDNDEAFARKISELRGKSTVLLVTHREDHMRLADILLVMHKGELVHAGAPDKVLSILRGKRA